MKRLKIKLKPLKTVTLGLGILFLMTGCASSIPVDQCIENDHSEDYAGIYPMFQYGSDNTCSHQNIDEYIKNISLSIPITNYLTTLAKSGLS